jgi:WD40 repeat protein
VSGDEGGAVILWDPVSGKPIGQPLFEHHAEISALAFSPDGRSFASRDLDGVLRLWPGPEAWVDELCGKLTENMSLSQWSDWVSPGIGYIQQCPGLPIPLDAAAR